MASKTRESRRCCFTSTSGAIRKAPMQYTRLGNSGLIVSRFAFGAMTFGSGRGAMAAVSKVDQNLATEMVARSIDAGINFFNTADAYAGGDSERMLAAALGNHRKDVVITTKVGFRTGDA